MSNKQPKIKRYHSSGTFGHRHTGLSIAVRILLIVLGCATLFAIGWFGADSIRSWWHTRDTAPKADSSSVPESVSVSSGDIPGEDESESTAVQSATDEAGTWAEVPLAACADENTLSQALQALRDAGVTHAVVTLKDEAGYVHYNSAVERAAAAVQTPVDLEMFVRLAGENDLVPCARLAAFRDPLAAYADRALAVGYQDQTLLWLDTSAEMGGKPWLNPYSADARQYIVDLTEEVCRAGFADIVFANVQFPSGYGLELCGYGADTTAHPKGEALKECVGLLQDTLNKKSARAWFEWPAAAFTTDTQAVTYTAPAALGAERIVLTVAPGADGAAPVCDEAALDAAVKTAQQNGALRFGLNTVGIAADTDALTVWKTAAHTAGFTHFEG